MNNIKNAFSSRFKEARKRKKISMRELAKMIGTTHQSIFLWENGKAFPRGDFVEKIAKALDVDEEWLLGIGYHLDLEEWMYEIINANDEKKNAIKNIWDIIKKL